MMTGREKILKECLSAYKKSNYNGIVLLPTGTGKGRLMIEVCKVLKPKSILYLCDSEDNRDKTFIHELHKWDAAYLIPQIDRACYQTAYKWKDKHYDLILADEFDFCLTDKYSEVFKNNTFTHKVLVSATLDKAKRALATKIAPIIYEKKQREAIEEKVLNKINFYFITYDLNPMENYRYLEFNKRFKVLLEKPQNKFVQKQLDALKIERKQFLNTLKSSVEVTKWLISTLLPKNEKILIFCGLSSQADKICKFSYHSNNDNKEALISFEKGEIKCLCVVDKVTRGANINEVRNIIIESPGSSKTKTVQKTGRGLRLHVDDSLNVFFLIPYFHHPFHKRKATIVWDWVMNSTEDMDISEAKIVNYQSKNI